jgi:hypothetical protein
MRQGLIARDVCIAEPVLYATIMAELDTGARMVEVMTSRNNIMNGRFETLCPLGILPGLVNLAGKLSRRDQSQ